MAHATISDLREHGLEVWDCLHDEDVLAIVWALAFEGDNPMASEFAAHIGMSGTMLCRICMARGTDSTHRPQGDDGTSEWLREFMTVSSRLHFIQQTLIRNMLTSGQAGELRSRDQTLAALEAQLARAVNGAPSAVDTMATATGVKDKYFAHFVAILQDAVKTFRAENAGLPDKDEEARKFLTELRAKLPKDIFSPVLGIPG